LDDKYFFDVQHSQAHNTVILIK